ncbi:dTDP-4-amino-4,6-dideoxy-D-glucose ammonia-lyase [Streptomyces sp. NPDC001793]|uniref:dTDP-4-amino-4,6-dideoxy-D-glucose ammonia-lyase n=1 Tax=Streptomyces sp. NPDC001793 TaxID=3154657 RepID=UPI003331E2E9
MVRQEAVANAVAVCTLPGSDPAAASEALRHELVTAGHMTDADAREAAGHLVRLARIYGAGPFTPLEKARHQLGVDRSAFRRLLDVFGVVPQLRSAVENGPSGKYWTNTLLPLERKGVFDAALHHKPVFPYSVGLYPGPTCMFRCHFCVRVTGARYDHSALDDGNKMFAALIDDIPTDNPDAMYVSGGLEPLTNPGLGSLVRRAAGRGFRLTLYTNAFALTDRTLERQGGLWRLHAVRTSLYGLNDAEYAATTGKKAAFGRVKANLERFQRLRSARAEPVKLGLNYIVLPGRGRRLLDLVDFIAELNAAAPDRPLDFVTLREDYSGRPDGLLSGAERADLQEALTGFREKVAARTPTLHVDYGYALNSLSAGADAELVRIRPETMRPTAHPQVAVQVDLLGDVYLYREAGFPGLPGADRYSIGKVSPGTTLTQVVERFVTSGGQIPPAEGDEYFMDGFDQVVTARLNQLEVDTADGWADQRGFLR